MTMLELAARVLPYETTLGAMTLEQLAAEAGVVRYCPTTEAYRAVAPVARAQRLGVVNAGYVYDADLLSRLAARPGWTVEVLSSKSMHQAFTPVDPVREAETLHAIERMTADLGADDCEVTLREFAPADVPAVLLRDPEAERRLERRREQAEAEGGWRALLGSFDQGDEPIVARTLVLNDANPTVRTLLATHDSPALPAAFGPGTRLKVYVRDAEDLPVVAEALDARFGDRVPRVLLHAAICRRELALEIDGVHDAG